MTDYRGSCFLALNIRSLLNKGNSPFTLLSTVFLPFFLPVFRIDITRAGRVGAIDLLFNREACWFIIKYLYTIYITSQYRNMSIVKLIYEGGHYFTLKE